jgi:hypothetical protein
VYAPSLSITEPQPGLLDAIVANDHLTLSGLLAELSRDPDTPTVARQLAEVLDHHLRVHLSVGENVLLTLLGDTSLGDLHERAVRIDEELRSHLDDLLANRDGRIVPIIRELTHALAGHVDLEERELLPELRARVGEREMSRLGFEFSRLSDTGLLTPPPAGAAR